MKRAAWLTVLTISSILISSVNVFAGEINSAEAGVISYCSQTFHYRGKDYKATAAALGALRAKLSADGVDLTPEQADKAKAKVSSNIATGVASGYLAEVVSTPGEGTSPTPEASKGPEASKNPSASQEPVAGQEPNVTEDPQTGKEPLGSAKPKPGKAEKPVIQKEPTIVKDYEAYYQKTEQLDGSEHKSVPVTKEEYINSVLTVSDGEKTLYSGDLPIKNTGYNMETVWIIAIGLIALLGITIYVACKKIIFAQRHEKK